jgi:hypothetical protein
VTCCDGLKDHCPDVLLAFTERNERICARSSEGDA